MAKVIGVAGRYTAFETLKKIKWAFRLCIITSSICFFISGFTFGAFVFDRKSLIIFAAGIFGALALLSVKYADKRLDELEKERRNYEKGTKGEESISNILQKLPSAYYVFNDFSIKFGNIDHVVIGPTGVFIIETKNWTGSISLNEEGELLVNGRPTDKSEVHNFHRRVMTTKSHIQGFRKDKAIWLNALLVFTSSATLKIKKNEIKYIECIDEENLVSRITEEKSKKLNETDIKDYVNAFTRLARMDTGFEETVSTMNMGR